MNYTFLEIDPAIYKYEFHAEQSDITDTEDNSDINENEMKVEESEVTSKN